MSNNGTRKRSFWERLYLMTVDRWLQRRLNLTKYQ